MQTQLGLEVAQKTNLDICHLPLDKPSKTRYNVTMKTQKEAGKMPEQAKLRVVYTATSEWWQIVCGAGEITVEDEWWDYAVCQCIGDDVMFIRCEATK